MLIFGKQAAQQCNSNSDCNDFFRCAWKPDKGKICGSNSDHPANLKDRSDAQKDIRPTICDEPCNAEAEEKPGVQTELDSFL